jgi:hypothetical protein
MNRVLSGLLILTGLGLLAMASIGLHNSTLDSRVVLLIVAGCSGGAWIALGLQALRNKVSHP